MNENRNHSVITITKKAPDDDLSESGRCLKYAYELLDMIESPNDQDQRPGESVSPANQTVVPGSLDRLVGLAPELDLSKSEKQEAIEWIKLVHPQSLNSTIVLDKSDIPYDLKDTLFFFSQDKSETQLSSNRFLSSVRQYKASQNQDRAVQNEM